MQRKNYLNRSGVIMDLCKEHGLWLDAGELKQIQEWTALGGKTNALKESLDEKHIHARAKTRKRQVAHKKRNAHYSSDLMRSRNRLDDAVDMISSLFGRF